MPPRWMTGRERRSRLVDRRVGEREATKYGENVRGNPTASIFPERKWPSPSRRRRRLRHNISCLGERWLGMLRDLALSSFL